MIGHACLVSSATLLFLEKQNLVLVETAVVGRLVKRVIFAVTLFGAGKCAMDFRSLLHNGLRLVRSARLFHVVHGLTYF